MGNNKTENSKKQGKREKIAATPNKWKNQTTEFAGNYEAWQPLTPQKPVGYPEEVLEKLSSLDAKMSGLETLSKQISDLASTLNTVSSDVELLHKEIKRLRKENCSLREKNRLLEEQYPLLTLISMTWNSMTGYKTRKFMEYIWVMMKALQKLKAKSWQWWKNWWK